jgi:hypothetical protein
MTDKKRTTRLEKLENDLVKLEEKQTLTKKSILSKRVEISEHKKSETSKQIGKMDSDKLAFLIKLANNADDEKLKMIEELLAE